MNEIRQPLQFITREFRYLDRCSLYILGYARTLRYRIKLRVITKARQFHPSPKDVRKIVGT